MLSSTTYWDSIADQYQADTRIACDDFHYGPLLPGDCELRLLPDKVEAARCLELGCGAGQNSIYLASCGARCVALDCAGNQLNHGLELARRHGVEVRFLQANMAMLPLANEARFDIIHSAYALPFAGDQKRVIAEVAARLEPGGVFVCSTAHPLSTAEWLELDDGTQGIFLPDYFNPEADVRAGTDGEHAQCRPLPVSRIVEWLTATGLVIDALLEPKPLPVNEMSEEERLARIPYDSAAWRDLYGEMNRIPAVVIYVARKR